MDSASGIPGFWISLGPVPTAGGGVSPETFTCFPENVVALFRPSLWGLCGASRPSASSGFSQGALW